MERVGGRSAVGYGRCMKEGQQKIWLESHAIAEDDANMGVRRWRIGGDGGKGWRPGMGPEGWRPGMGPRERIRFWLLHMKHRLIWAAETFCSRNY